MENSSAVHSTEIVAITDNNGSSSVEITPENPNAYNEVTTENTTSATATSNSRTIKRLATIFKGKGKISESSPSNDKMPVELIMPQLYKNPAFEFGAMFRDLKARVDHLIPDLKFCLYCFSVFPEGAIVKRRLMTYWWMGESFIPPFLTVDKMEEEVAIEFFDKLIAKGFIVPVHYKRRLVADRCRMHPFVRLAVIMLAERAGFFDFDPEGNPTATFSNSNRACLVVGKGFTTTTSSSSSNSSSTPHQYSEKLCTLFNCSEYYLYFKPEWFFWMKAVHVLYLGLWDPSAKYHIEVDDTAFLSCLKNMKHLRFFSLQGVSGITMLPDSISKPYNLLILDLRACHSLEVIPEGIGSLRSLTHLDISGCYLLEHMPKSLGLLSQLQVLKGFIVVFDGGNQSSCTLDDLAKLPRLRKLSIFTAVMDFPTKKHLLAFNQFTALRKLTIEWGEDSINIRIHPLSSQIHHSPMV